MHITIVRMSSPARGLGWNVGGHAARAITQFALGVVLARLLGPAAFGVMAVGWLAVAFCRLIDPGMGSSLVKLGNPRVHDIRYAVTLQLGVSLALGCILAVAATPVAQVLGDAAAAPYVRAMAVLLPLFAFAQIGNALLELRLDFRTIQLANLIPYIVGYLGLGVPLALHGAGPWALVAAAVSQNLLTTCWLYAATCHPCRFAWRATDGAHIAGFGAHTSGIALATYLASNADQVAVSHSGTASDLGQYNRASALLSTPMLAIGNALTNWLYPMFIRQSLADRRHGFIAAITGLGLATIVPFAVVAGCSQSVVAVVYGAGWEACARLSVPLALAMPGWLFGMVASPLLWSCDAVTRDHQRQWLATAILAIALGIGMYTQTSPLGLAWITCACSWIRAAMLLDAAQKVAAWRWWNLTRALLGTCIVGAAAGIGAWHLEKAMLTDGKTPLQIALTNVVLALVALVCTWLLGRHLNWFPEFTNIIVIKRKYL